MSRPGDRGISIALAIHSFDPTKDATSDSAEYNTQKAILERCLLIFKSSLIIKIDRGGV